MKMIIVALACINTAAACFISTIHAEEKIVLSYKPKQNETLIYRTTATLKQKQTVGDMNLDSEVKRTTVTTWQLIETDEKGHHHWQIEIKQLNVKVKVGSFGEYTFDSKSNERDTASLLGAALTPVYDSLNGAYLNIVTDAQGNVIKVTGYEELIGKLVKDDPFSMQYTFGGTDIGAKLDYQERFAVFNKKAVKENDTWELNYDLDIPKIGKFEGTKQFTHKGVEKSGDRNLLKIGISYDAAINADYKFAGGHATGAISTSESSGTARFDPVAGQLISLKSKGIFSGNVSLELAGNTFDVPTEQNWNIDVKLLDKLPE